MSLTAYVPVVWVDYADDPDLNASYLNHLETGIKAVTDEVLALEAAIPLAYQPISSELTALSSLSGPGYSKRAGAGSWSVVASIPQADISGLTTSLAAKENALGNPSTTGWVLSSTTGGVRSWVPMSGGVSTVFGRTGNVTAQSGDYTAAQVGALGVSATAVNSSALGGAPADNFVQGINSTRTNSALGAVAISSLSQSGFYDLNLPTDAPNASGNWTHVIHHQGYSWPNPSQYSFQIAASFSNSSITSWGDETYAMRTITGGSIGAWRKLWHDGNLSIADLGGPYLPISGGSLTGALTGTSATFPGGISASSATLNGELSILPFSTGTTGDSHWRFVNRANILSIEKYVGGGFIAAHLSFSAAGAATFSAGITAASFARPGGTSAQFLKADGSTDSTAYAAASSLSNYALSSSLPGLYQPLENQRVSTTSSVDFNSITTSGYINAHGIIYANATLRTAGLTIDSYSITANTNCQINGTGWTVNAPMTFAVSPVPYGGALLGSSTYPWDAYVSRLRAGAGSIAIESPLAFGASARIVIDSGGWEVPSPAGAVFAVEGQSIGPVSNNLRLPSGATFGIYYRNDSGDRTLLSSGSINMYGRTGLLMGGADGNWHLLHV